jgi:hypothetical protein
MSEGESAIIEHYAKSGLLQRLEAALRADGADPAHPTLEALAPYDHFHGRGLEATEDMAALVPVRSTDHVLDVGSFLRLRAVSQASSPIPCRGPRLRRRAF